MFLAFSDTFQDSVNKQMCPIFLPVEILLKSLDKWVKWEIHAFLEATIIVLIETVWLIIMKLRLKMKNGSHRYDVNRIRPRHVNTSILNIKCFSGRWWLHAISHTEAVSEAEFMENLSNTEAELKKKHCLKKCVV